MPDTIDIYERIRANRIGGFSKEGFDFDIIRPGFDAQGRKRNAWTQFVYQGCPVYEVKLDRDLRDVLKLFREQWDRTIGKDRALGLRALEQTISARKRAFMDGTSGENPADALPREGRKDRKTYVS